MIEKIGRSELYANVSGATVDVNLRGAINRCLPKLSRTIKPTKPNSFKMLLATRGLILAIERR
jgi:hypothetical protein